MPIDYSGPEGDTYHQERHKEIFGNQALLSAWGAYAHHTYVPGLEQRHALLEIGAGTGINLMHMKNIANVYAVEPAEFAREHCRSLGINAFPALEELPEDIRFDYILMRHVLEHVPEPLGQLQSIKNFLKPGGSLVLVLPVEPQVPSYDTSDMDHHLYCWNIQTLGNLLRLAEYNLESGRINYYNGRQIFLRVFDMFGVAAYAKCMSLLGRLTSSSEIIVSATPA
jgi:SAM-dependent methyltransferase